MTDRQAARQLKNDIRNYLRHFGKVDETMLQEVAYQTAIVKEKDATTEKQKERWAAVKALLACLIFPIMLTAQTRPNYWLKQGFSTGLAMYAGFTRHERDVIREKYKAYQAVWPKANPKWSNPQLSRYNKYKNGDEAQGRAKLIGNINKPVFMTDKYHLSTTITRTAYSGVLSLQIGLYDKPTIKQIGRQVLIIFAADCVGNGISTLIYKY